MGSVLENSNTYFKGATDLESEGRRNVEVAMWNSGRRTKEKQQPPASERAVGKHLSSLLFLVASTALMGYRLCLADGWSCPALGTAALGAPHCCAGQHGVRRGHCTPRSQDEGVMGSGGATGCAPACSLSAYLPLPSFLFFSLMEVLRQIFHL